MPSITRPRKTHTAFPFPISRKAGMDSRTSPINPPWTTRLDPIRSPIYPIKSTIGTMIPITTTINSNPFVSP